MGHPLLLAHARNVCSSIMDGIDPSACSSAGSHGHQAPLFHAPRRRPVVRLGAESNPCPSRGRAPTEFGGSRLLPLSELHSVAMDSGGRYRKASAWNLAGMARWSGGVRQLLATASSCSTAADP